MIQPSNPFNPVCAWESNEHPLKQTAKTTLYAISCLSMATYCYALYQTYVPTLRNLNEGTMDRKILKNGEFHNTLATLAFGVTAVSTLLLKEISEI